MRVVLFCHSVLSDYNHGNAHFLRGVVTELALRGHDVRVYEPIDAWSVRGLVAEKGEAALEEARRVYPALRVVRYHVDTLDLEAALTHVDLAIVHEWSDPELVARVGEHRRSRGRYRLFFHDTHHRAVTDEAAIARCDLRHYDGVLAFGRSLADVYLARGGGTRIFVWHEAADVRLFHPRPRKPERDLVWIGNFGDEERTAELEEFLLGPVQRLGLSAKVYGTRYPAFAREALGRAGIELGGLLANYLVPEALSAARLTVHVPRRPYAKRLPGIPTIRPFEAMACGVPLVTAPFSDVEGLFTEGRDYLMAKDGDGMTRHLSFLLTHPAEAALMATNARANILARHTVSHRVDELLDIVASLGAPS